jgi:hypothetical protein
MSLCLCPSVRIEQLGSHWTYFHEINKTTNVLRLGAIVFIIPWEALYMFRVLFTPIIRNVLKLYMQLLVQSCIGMVSDPVGWKMIGSRERTALLLWRFLWRHNKKT